MKDESSLDVYEERIKNSAFKEKRVALTSRNHQKSNSKKDLIRDLSPPDEAMKPVTEQVSDSIQSLVSICDK